MFRNVVHISEVFAFVSKLFEYVSDIVCQLCCFEACFIYWMSSRCLEFGWTVADILDAKRLFRNVFHL